MKTLYLHVGTPKTATSSIQKFLAGNRSVLEAHGYCYPRSLHKYPDVNPRRNGHFLVGKVANKNGGHKRKTEEAYLQEGYELIVKSFAKFDNVILSDESIWFGASYSRKDVFERLKEEADQKGYVVKVIVYLRRQDQFLLSKWNQAVKQNVAWGSGLTCEEYLKASQDREPDVYQYGKRLDVLAGILGKENLIVRVFERDQWIEGSIIQDFMYHIGFETIDDFKQEEETVNLRLGKNESEIKRILNKNENLQKQEATYLGNFLKEMSAEEKSEAPSQMLSTQEVEQFLQKFEAENMRVAKEYQNRTTPLFSTEIKDLPKWHVNNSTMQEDMLCFVTNVMVDLKRENESQQKEIETLQKQLDKLTADFVSFKDKVRHPFRTVVNRLFHKNEEKKS